MEKILDLGGEACDTAGSGDYIMMTERARESETFNIVVVCAGPHPVLRHPDADDIEIDIIRDEDAHH